MKNGRVRAAFESAAVLTVTAGFVVDGVAGLAVLMVGLVFVAIVWSKGGFQ